MQWEASSSCQSTNTNSTLLQENHQFRISQGEDKMRERSFLGVKGTQMRNYAQKRGWKTIKCTAGCAKHGTVKSTCVQPLSIESWNTTQFNGSVQTDLIVDNRQFSLW